MRTRAGYVALGVLGIALTAPGQTIGVSVFVDPVLAELGLTRSAVSGAYLVGTLLGALALPSVGRFLDQRGVRVGFVWIGVAFAAGIGFVSRSWSLVTLAIGFTLIRMFGQGSLTLVSTVAVTKWVSERRGAALGMLTTVGGAMLGLAPLVLNLLVQWTDWRTAWAISGVVVLAVVPAIGWFGFKAAPARSAPASTAPAVDVDRAAAVRTYRMWVLAAATGCTGLFATALNFHQISLLGEAGLTPTAAAAMFIPQVIGTAAAGYLFGWLSDRFPSRWLLGASMLSLAIALALTRVLEPGVAVIGYSVALGVAGGSLRSVSAAAPPRWFGIGHIGSIQGLLTLVGVTGSAIGPLYLSVGRDWTGAYQTVASASLVVPVAIAVAGWWIRDETAAVS